jgi:hypothetical protein
MPAARCTLVPAAKNHPPDSAVDPPSLVSLSNSKTRASIVRR